MSTPQPTSVLKGDEESVKSGYIAGVVILAVAVVVLTVVAIIFAIRNSRMRPVTGHFGENRDDFDGVGASPQGDAFASDEDDGDAGEEDEEGENDDEDDDDDDA